MKNLKIMVQNSNITERQLTYIAMKSKSRDDTGKGCRRLSSPLRD